MKVLDILFICFAVFILFTLLYLTCLCRAVSKVWRTYFRGYNTYNILTYILKVLVTCDSKMSIKKTIKADIYLSFRHAFLNSRYKFPRGFPLHVLKAVNSQWFIPLEKTFINLKIYVYKKILLVIASKPLNRIHNWPLGLMDCKNHTFVYIWLIRVTFFDIFFWVDFI